MNFLLFSSLSTCVLPETSFLFNRWEVTDAHSSFIQTLMSCWQLSSEVLLDSGSFSTLPPWFPDMLNQLSPQNTAISGRHWYLHSSCLQFCLQRFNWDNYTTSHDTAWLSLPWPTSPSLHTFSFIICPWSSDVKACVWQCFSNLSIIFLFRGIKNNLQSTKFPLRLSCLRPAIILLSTTFLPYAGKLLLTHHAVMSFSPYSSKASSLCSFLIISQ